MLPFIQFASLFFALPLRENTIDVEVFMKECEERSYEEILDYMVYNDNTLQFICERNF